MSTEGLSNRIITTVHENADPILWTLPGRPNQRQQDAPLLPLRVREGGDLETAQEALRTGLVQIWAKDVLGWLERGGDSRPQPPDVEEKRAERLQGASADFRILEQLQHARGRLDELLDQMTSGPLRYELYGDLIHLQNEQLPLSVGKPTPEERMKRFGWSRLNAIPVSGDPLSEEDAAIEATIDGSLERMLRIMFGSEMPHASDAVAQFFRLRDGDHNLVMPPSIESLQFEFNVGPGEDTSRSPELTGRIPLQHPVTMSTLLHLLRNQVQDRFDRHMALGSNELRA